MSDTRAFLLAHTAAYPALTLTDLFKALYQSAFGCEHLVADPSAAEAYIAAEAEGARPCGRKSVEPLDGPYVRVHLDMLTSRMLPIQIGLTKCSRLVSARITT